MTKIVKFPKDKIEYSDHFFRKVDPKAVTHYIRIFYYFSVHWVLSLKSQEKCKPE